MSVRDQDRFDVAICDRFEIRQHIFAQVFRMHPAIEDKAVVANLEVIRVRADLSLPGEINEFQRARVKASMRDGCKTKWINVAGALRLLAPGFSAYRAPL